MSGLMGSVVSGMAMGTGSAVAQRAMDSMLGPREMVVKHQNQPAAQAPEESLVLRMASWAYAHAWRGLRRLHVPNSRR
jgi:hypothetical protein